jgi:hypothetical protein
LDHAAFEHEPHLRQRGGVLGVAGAQAGESAVRRRGQGGVLAQGMLAWSLQYSIL